MAAPVNRTGPGSIARAIAGAHATRDSATLPTMAEIVLRVRLIGGDHVDVVYPPANATVAPGRNRRSRDFNSGTLAVGSLQDAPRRGLGDEPERSVASAHVRTTGPVPQAT